MNQDAIMQVIPDSKDNAKSLREIAQDMGLELNSYVDWIRAERRLSSSLRSLARWGWVASERRQNEEGHKFWYSLSAISENCAFLGPQVQPPPSKRHRKKQRARAEDLDGGHIKRL